ncbi:PLP-dependent cysteine synthase family protein [Butyrivibrio fibrisolvens]|jgi:cysteine synthase|uniref:Cysteine synthase n=1 Tax=Butyrivibrio fibrisolvens TaxID=831 RepID=A0A1H9S305_BUTFI|nr:cysteine synthase family protein [Butyrivibrio fibrisolvens]MBQ1458350.1 cysteine synthase family protein [Butyrivibrio sp.]PWT27623.1 cysteine synthase [Butyrivibrio fibrisolvens]SER79308.1 cystathionine beta-synthase (acetylserine-dependent) [Butyrivibrio fibrisolvens]
MKYYESLKEAIGNTPMLKLQRADESITSDIYAKLELFNPCGSVKDRVGYAMVEDAEKRGILKPGSVIIEATAGNTGIGVAFGALGKGYKVIFVVPLKFSPEKQTLMRMLGAEIINTPTEGGMQGAIKKADELVASTPGAVQLGQFVNPENPAVHYRTTGPEIWRDMSGHIDYFVAGAGSGGTFSGIVKYLKEKNPNIIAVLADPVGSTMGGGEHADYKIEGIGNDFIADTMDMSLVDRVVKVNDDQAYGQARELAHTEGVFAGSSSGAALYVAKQIAREEKGKNIVTVFPDRGDRYFSEHLYE